MVLYLMASIKSRWYLKVSGYGFMICIVLPGAPYSNINKVAENWRIPISQDEQVGRFSMATMNKMVFPEARSKEETKIIKPKFYL